MSNFEEKFDQIYGNFWESKVKYLLYRKSLLQFMETVDHFLENCAKF